MVEVLGDVRVDDRALHGRVYRPWGSGQAAGLRGDGLVEQPDGQARVTGWFVSFGLAQEGGGLVFGFPGQRQTVSPARVPKIAVSWTGV